MRIAVIGSGIAGLSTARQLSREHEVTLFEANNYLGGHTHTHSVEQDGRRYDIDTGFIVYNPHNYPLLNAMLDELGVASQPTIMSFSVQNEASGLEYNATNLDTLFCQRRNLLSPRFMGMVRDLLRFYREAPALLETNDAGPSLGEYLQTNGYGMAFRDDHLIPMASALWSSPAAQILSFPARYLVQFMANHQMLRVSDRPEWRVVTGGSSSYIAAMRAGWNVNERLSCPVWSVQRGEYGALVTSSWGVERFDHVVMACHSDQTLAILTDASAGERSILGAITYQANDTVLHTDASLLPRHRKAWAGWNAFIPRDTDAGCSVSYCMNLLQGVQSTAPFIVTLNRTGAIDPAKILRRMQYHHPLYSAKMVAAQTRRQEIQGQQNTWFAGAYWGWGFHEDGMRSAVEVVTGINAAGNRPAAAAPSTGATPFLQTALT